MGYFENNEKKLDMIDQLIVTWLIFWVRCLFRVEYSLYKALEYTRYRNKFKVLLFHRYQSQSRPPPSTTLRAKDLPTLKKAADNILIFVQWLHRRLHIRRAIVRWGQADKRPDRWIRDKIEANFEQICGPCLTCRIPRTDYRRIGLFQHALRLLSRM